MRKEHLKLTESEHSYLTTLTTSGQLKARKFKRAMTLLLLDQGKTMIEVSQVLSFAYPSVVALKQNFLSHGLECLSEKPRSGRPPVIDGIQRAQITALACSTPPQGYARWSLRLLADRAVELNLVESISYKQVGVVLKKTNSSRI
jgi:putative transposase